jgi:oligoendopeptidase F
LFGLGLYSVYQKEGVSFVAQYRDLLRHSGSESAVEIARRAGFNIETAKFWRDAMAPIEREIEFLEAHANGGRSIDVQ